MALLRRTPAEPFGVRWYVGMPQSGKSTLALAHLWTLHLATGMPALVIDEEEVRQLSGVPHVARAGRA